MGDLQSVVQSLKMSGSSCEVKDIADAQSHRASSQSSTRQAGIVPVGRQAGILPVGRQAGRQAESEPSLFQSPYIGPQLKVCPRLKVCATTPGSGICLSQMTFSSVIPLP